MPRLARLDAPGVLHHVIGRGIERRKIFYRDKDREDFVDRLADLAEKGAWTVYAWVLMPNHYHLLIKTKNQPLADNMRKLLTGYAVNFNRRHKRVGHLFQNRYKSIVCQEENYLRELVRYLHLNPLRAGLVQDMEQLNRYPWTGHSALLGRVKREWQDTGYVLSFFGQVGESPPELFGLRNGRDGPGAAAGFGRGRVDPEFGRLVGGVGLKKPQGESSLRPADTGGWGLCGGLAIGLGRFNSEKSKKYGADHGP